MLTITQATPEQASLVYDIMLAAFEEYRSKLNPPSGVFAETVETVRRFMSEGGALLAWENEAAIGSMRYIFKPDHMYVGRVSVLPAYRGRGIATAMMREVEPIARAHGYRSIHLGARLVLQSNIAFYERLGYRVIDTRMHDKGGSMVVEMRKEL
ncbi:MAG TPA: GNAT family N-acetyltransferase [Oceanobacillus sp.]|nr:GNAT family N-acetyltransferase [Oceanobacillus sp.]